MTKRVLRLWIDRRGNVRRELLRGSYSSTVPDLDILNAHAPSFATTETWRARGFTLCNWHVIEK